jgi:Fe2+ or Zn2+ uptake regulation protein
VNGGADLHQVVADRLRRADQRYTAGRRAIVELLVRAGHPISIGDVSEQLPGMPRSSAYRHLMDLQVAGAVRRVAANDDFARFELAEDLTEHHHHLLCVGCGKVADVTPSDGFELTVTETLDEVSRSTGFRPHGHRLDVFGLCAVCQ